MQVTRDIQSTRKAISAAKAASKSIGFVPTMGFLHAGHLSLVKSVSRKSDFVVGYIFINPAQFNNVEDLENYPIDIDGDLKKFEEAGADLVFIPTPEEIYPENFQAWVELEQISKEHEGSSRPGHFRGVATVLTIMFNIVQPDFAIFGEKDFQQLRLIEQMVSDLKFPIQILRGETVREPDGLAMSSRNARLTKSERNVANALYQAMSKAKIAYKEGQKNIEALRSIVIDSVSLVPEFNLDYFCIVQESDLKECEIAQDNSRMLIAAYIGAVRLIDNMAFI